MATSTTENPTGSDASKQGRDNFGPALSPLQKIGNSRHLGLYLMAPAFLFVLLFFVMPVILTGVFGFTNMSTATGITGGSYVASPSSLRELSDQHALGEIADQLGQEVYTVDEAGLTAAAEGGAGADTLN